MLVAVETLRRECDDFRDSLARAALQPYDVEPEVWGAIRNTLSQLQAVQRRVTQ
jgi:hypothetical protein